MQRSDSFVLGALLSFSGGLQDAYTFNIRDRVFANAQTGNVVLMGQNFLLGNWDQGIDYMFPVISFVAGVFLSEFIESRYKYNKKMHWRQIVLLFEFLLLFMVGLLPLEYERIANMTVSFACAMQVQAFRRLRANNYASTMVIGNLKNGTHYMVRFLRSKTPQYLIYSLQYYTIIVIFAIGAGVGGVLSRRLGIRTIWICCGIIMIAGLIMIKVESLNFSYLKRFPVLHEKFTKTTEKGDTK